MDKDRSPGTSVSARKIICLIWTGIQVGGSGFLSSPQEKRIYFKKKVNKIIQIYK